MLVKNKVSKCGSVQNIIEEQYGVHGKFGHALDIRLKQVCERRYINLGHTKEEFINLIRKELFRQLGISN